MKKNFIYNGTFEGYAEFTYFISKYFPSRRMPTVEFDRGTKNMYIKSTEDQYVIQPGETFVLETHVEIIGKASNELVG